LHQWNLLRQWDRLSRLSRLHQWGLLSRLHQSRQSDL